MSDDCSYSKEEYGENQLVVRLTGTFNDGLQSPFEATYSAKTRRVFHESKGHPGDKCQSTYSGRFTCTVVRTDGTLCEDRIIHNTEEFQYLNRHQSCGKACSDLTTFIQTVRGKVKATLEPCAEADKKALAKYLFDQFPGRLMKIEFVSPYHDVFNR